MDKRIKIRVSKLVHKPAEVHKDILEVHCIKGNNDNGFIFCSKTVSTIYSFSLSNGPG